MRKYLLARDFSPLYRALGLLLIGIGALVVGIRLIPIESLIEPISGFSTSVVIGVSVGIATGGVLIGGIPGMLVFALANAFMGAAVFEADIPSWLYALGLPSLTAGFALRIFSPI